MAAITHMRPTQDNFSSYALEEEGIPTEIIVSVHQEIREILALARRLSERDLYRTVMEYSFLHQYLDEIASPQFWNGKRGKRAARENRQLGKNIPIALSKVETLEVVLLELKRFEEKRVVIRTKEICASPHLYQQRIQEHAGMQELEGILASAIVQEKNAQEDNCLIVDQSVGLGPYEMLALQKSSTGYQGEIMQKRGTHPLSVASSNNLHRNSHVVADLVYQPLFLDEKNQPIRGTAITFHTQATIMGLQSIVKQQPLDSQFILQQTIVSYHINLGSATPSLTFSFAVRKNAQGAFVCGYISSPLDVLPPAAWSEEYIKRAGESLDKMAQESKALVAAFQKQAPEVLDEDQCILLACPTSKKDWDYLNQQFLLALIRNIESKESSEEEREQSLYLLQHYIDQVELELPAQEGEEGETREMTPKEAVVEILKLLPKEQPGEKLDPQLLERDRQRAHAFKPKRKKALAAAEGEAKEEPPPAAEAALLLSDRQKEVIEEIYYEGKPQKAKAFFDFVRALLRQQEGVWFSQKGSHFTAHREGKVSVTLVRPHGRDATARGSLKHQRNVLRQLMGWDRGNHLAFLM